MPIGRAIFYAATLAAAGLGLRSALGTSIELPWAIAAIAAYLAIIAVGVVVLRLGMFVDVIWRGPDDARGVALTFDDGPSPEHTPRVLDMLDEAGVKATFFVIGHKVEKHRALTREIAARGHGIGLHGYAHDRFFAARSPRFVREDLERELALLEDVIGERPLMFRPPIGHSSPRVAKVVDALDLVVVGWGIRALDGLGKASADKLAARVRRGLRDGVIVQLHDAAERDDFEPASVRALPAILAAMKEKDLDGVRVDAWAEG